MRSTRPSSCPRALSSMRNLPLPPRNVSGMRRPFWCESYEYSCFDTGFPPASVLWIMLSVRPDFPSPLRSIRAHLDYRELVPPHGCPAPQAPLLCCPRRPLQVSAPVESESAGGRRPPEAAARVLDEHLAAPARAIWRARALTFPRPQDRRALQHPPRYHFGEDPDLVSYLYPEAERPFACSV